MAKLKDLSKAGPPPVDPRLPSAYRGGCSNNLVRFPQGFCEPSSTDPQKCFKCGLTIMPNLENRCTGIPRDASAMAYKQPQYCNLVAGTCTTCLEPGLGWGHKVCKGPPPADSPAEKKTVIVLDDETGRISEQQIDCRAVVETKRTFVDGPDGLAMVYGPTQHAIKSRPDNHLGGVDV